MTTVMLGRATEIETLDTVIQSAAAGRGAVLHIVGEPGIGKTSLCEEALVLAGDAGFDTAWGRSVEGAPAFWPWRSVVTRWPEFDVGFDRFELFEGIVDELVGRAGDGAGLLVVLDDIHWADESSLRLLEHVARTAPEQPLVLVVTSRPLGARVSAPLASVTSSLARSGTVLELHGLGAEEIRQMAVVVTGTAIGEETARAMADRTNGNPFFAEQVLLLRRDGDLDPDSATVPAGVDAVVRARVSDLGDDVVEVLGAASVLGRTFDLAALRAVTGDKDPTAAVSASVDAGLAGFDAARTDRLRFVHAIVRDALLASLSLEQRITWHERALRFLHDRGDTPAAVLLGHAEAAVATLGTGPAIAHATEAAGAALDAQGFEEVGRLVDRAISLDPDAATRVELLMLAGTAAFHLDEHERSIACFTEAADVADGLDDTVAMAHALMAAGTGRLVGPQYAGIALRIRRTLGRLGPTERGQRADLLARLADLVLDPAERRALLNEAIDEARAIGDDRVLGTALGRLLLHGISWMPLAERLSMIEELRAISDRAGSAELHLDAEAIAVRVLVEAGDLDTALRTATALADDPVARAGSFELRAAPIIEVLVSLARGQAEVAEQVFGDLVGEFERRGRGASATSVLGTQMVVLQIELGRGPTMVPMLSALRTDPSLEPYRAMIDALIASAWALAGDADSASEAIDAALAHDLEVVARDWAGNGVASCGLLVEAMWLAGHASGASRVEPLLRPVADRNLVIGMLPSSIVCWTTHALGLCALLDGRPGDARPLFIDAVGRHRAMGALPLLGRSLLALAEAEVALMDGDAALAAAEEAAGLLSSSPLVILHQRAVSLVSALGGDRPDGPSEIERPATTTFVFTDIVSSTAQNAALGDRAWVGLLGAHASVVRALTVRHGGRLVKGLGDGWFATFPSAAAGTRFGLEVSASAPPSGLAIRVGVHTGEAQRVDGDHLGHDVNLAARVSAAADAGEVLVSGVVASILAGAREFDIGPAQTVELKGIPGPQAVHLVRP